LRITVGCEQFELRPGDTFTTPIGAGRSFVNAGTERCMVYVTRRGDHPAAPEFS
jgi:mannose-6-phosphate isomerase-like protein (cupin superfamily)